MNKELAIISIFLITSFQVFSQSNNLTKEYFIYKKEADLLFDKGDYLNARRNYALCLAENETDDYAKERLDQSKKCVDLIEKAKALTNDRRMEEAIPLLLEILNINPKDKIIQAKHLEYWSFKPLELMEKGDYEGAKLIFEESKSFPYNCDVCKQKLKTIDKYENAIIKADSANKSKNWQLAISHYNEAKKYNPNCKKCSASSIQASVSKKTEDSLGAITQKDFIKLWTLGNRYKEKGIRYEYTNYPLYSDYMCQAIKLYNMSISLAKDCSICQKNKILEIKEIYIVECEGFEKARKELNNFKRTTFSMGVLSAGLALYYANKYNKEGLPDQKTVRNFGIACSSIFFGLRIIIGKSKPEKLNCNTF